MHNDFFTPLVDAGSALQPFSGTLKIDEFIMQDNIPDGTPRSESRRYFPGFEVAFFTAGDNLVPANREIISSTGNKSYWGLILSPGKIWSEPDDDGMSRAAFPFILVGEDFNNAHNGLATFLFDDDSVSQFYFQITQETAPGIKVIIGDRQTSSINPTHSKTKAPYNLNSQQNWPPSSRSCPGQTYRLK